MLSRTADNLYWLARYVERAEYLARILEATQRLTALPLAYVGESNEWESAVATAGCAGAFYAVFSEANEENVTDFLAFLLRQSLLHPLLLRGRAHQRARAVRTALTMEMWDAINGTWLELRRYGNGPTSREELSRFLRWVQESSLRFDGCAYRTMLRNDAYWFTRLGVYLERADNTARILDVKYHMLLPAQEHVGGPLDYFQWAAILRSVSALTSYHWVYRESLRPWHVADLLILKEEMPRSLASCYENIVTNLDRIATAYGRQGPAQRLARGIRTRLQNSRMDDIFQRGLHEFIQSFIADNNRIGATITQQYLT
ncbi:MAG: alpha-E domain-containing protein [Pseudorhodoplanes sp.]|nr:alpha-E domain-containing protein [Pseudorhodoplanes sp.]